jgi:hypothetical protein
MVFSKPLLKEVFGLALAVAVLHYVAISLYLYWTTGWFDIMMHFLGGTVIGLIAAFVLYTSGYFHFPREHQGAVFATILGAVLVVGLGWELWELFLGWTDILADRRDTMIDIAMDVLGGMVAYQYAQRFIWPAKIN